MAKGEEAVVDILEEMRKNNAKDCTCESQYLESDIYDLADRIEASYARDARASADMIRNLTLMMERLKKQNVDSEAKLSENNAQLSRYRECMCDVMTHVRNVIRMMRRHEVENVVGEACKAESVLCTMFRDLEEEYGKHV